ncbi:ABC transporter ATP-binding protein [Streptomyces sp. NPDC048639]|uniref:ABC transporter ATP-binding protein n=1 Tax=Streptomyces sp. NPDC048639 TaxID=3365581 RepID=UPI003712EDDC
MLHVDVLTKHFAGLTALTDVSFQVAGGRVAGLIGPNGAGKTTLVNCLTGALTPTSGTARWKGRVITGRSPEQAVGIGVTRTFQQARLFPGRSVLDNVMAGAHSTGRAGMVAATLRLPAARRDEARMRAAAFEALDAVGCADLAGVPAGTLGAGRQRLVALARSLATGPELLLLDEPAAGLNDTETERLAVNLRAVATDRGLTLIVIEHHLAFVMALCDEVLVLAEGRLIAHGSPSEVRAEPAVISAYLGEDVPC